MIYPDTPLSFEQLQAIAPAFDLSMTQNGKDLYSFWNSEGERVFLEKTGYGGQDFQQAYTLRSLLKFTREDYRHYGYSQAQQDIRKALGL